MIRSLVVLLLILAPKASCIAASEDRGPQCLYVGLVSLGYEKSYEQFFDSRVGVPENGFLLSDLKELATNEGFETLLVRTSFDRLANRSKQEQFACVAWLPRGDFVVVADIDIEKQSYQIVDLSSIQDIPMQLFETQWDGEALLVSKKTLDPEGFYEPSSSRVLVFWLMSLFIVGLVVACLWFVGSRRGKRWRAAPHLVGVTLALFSCSVSTPRVFSGEAAMKRLVVVKSCGTSRTVERF
ncbi:cysteine peptidase family C39 domain-containing protein [Roseiconus lacunae]|uniref:cysteine peptidase family C39 domain-containing protein n=1 Tax=Roseiconus lacunae TaxID=2605694 RepID=UPI001E623EDA|nr:cysteine peptidase family C39 domain-containing protein [Roseiconus lacunae]MCD0458321.1 cysteine peptidase family C39 domain-containing protein [Roseiconus lacunae]